MLNKVKIPVSLGLGIDTKKDEKQLQGSLLSLQNAYIKKTGSLSKRYGYSPLSKEVLGRSSVTDAISLSKYDDEIILLANGAIYSYAPSSNKWGYKGVNLTSSLTIKNVVSNSYSQINPDLAIVNGGAVYAWEDSSGGIRSSFVDVASGVYLVPEIFIHATATRPRVVVCGTSFFIYYYNAGYIYCRKVSNGVYSDEATVASDVEAGGDDTSHFSVSVFPSSQKMVVAYRSTGGKLKLTYFLTSMVVGDRPNGCPSPRVFDTIDPISSLDTLIEDEFINIIVSSASTDYLQVDSNFDITIDVMEISTNQLSNVAMVLTTPTVIDIYGEKYGSSYIQFTRISAGVLDPTVPFDTNIIQRGAGLLTKPFYNEGFSYVIVSYQSKTRLQDTNFCINNNGDVLTRILATTAGGAGSTTSSLTGVWNYNGIYYTTFTKKSRLRSDGDINTSLVSVEVSLNDTAFSAASQLGKNLHLAGGYVKMYDGFSVVEHNFHLYPDEPTITAIPSGVADPSGGNDDDFYIETDTKELYKKIAGTWTKMNSGNFLEAGSYQYIILYEWIDYSGQVHRSSPSIAVSFTTVDAVSGNKLMLPTLLFTDKKGTRTPPVISVYRTIKDGSIFYLVSDDDNPIYNDTTVDAVMVADTMSDTEAQTRRLLYTTGGVLDNEQAPACTYLKTYKNRLFAVGLENSTEIAFSKEFVRGEGVSFSSPLIKQVDSKGGALTSLAELDDKLVLFKRANIFVMTGQGPTDTGSQDDFYITAITADIGCSEPKSIVETPIGVMFKSDKGIWLLDRGLTTKYIGDKVEKFNSLTINSATLVADTNQVRFTTLEGTTLVYDYFYDTWLTFTNQKAVSSINWQTDFVYAKADGDVFVEDSTSYLDAGIPIKSRIETGWFSLSGLQGYGRLYSIQLLGAYKSPHTLKVSISYDFNTAIKDIFTAQITDRPLYGSEDLIAEVFGGNEAENYQFEMKPRVQKCEAFKLIIEDISEGQASFDLSAITIQYGAKKGTNKLPRTRRM